MYVPHVTFNVRCLCLFKIENKEDSKLAISVLRINRKTLFIVLFVGILTTRSWTLMENFIICRQLHFEFTDLQ